MWLGEDQPLLLQVVPRLEARRHGLEKVEKAAYGKTVGGSIFGAKNNPADLKEHTPSQVSEDPMNKDCLNICRAGGASAERV